MMYVYNDDYDNDDDDDDDVLHDEILDVSKIVNTLRVSFGATTCT